MNVISDVKTDINMREIQFSISAEDLEAACERVFQKQKKNIAIKGFRKGKAPRKMVEKLYGEGAFVEDAINDLLPAQLGEIVKENSMELVDRPNVEIVSVSKAEGAVLKATFITKPEVTVSAYKGVHAPMKVREITDADIDQQIEALRQRQARIVEVTDRAAEMGDEVTMNFEGFIDGEAFEGGKGDKYPLRLGSGQFIPGFEDQIVGHSIGENFEINVTFPENYGDERYANKEATFKIEILGITAQDMPTVDDEFAKDVSEFDTLDELKADIRTKLTEQATQSAQVNFENAVFDTIIAGTDAVIPKVMFERRIDQQVADFEHRLQHQYADMKLADYLQLTGMTMEQLRDTYEEQAKKEVTLRLALEKVCELENITVTDDEVEDGISQMAAQYNVPVEVVKAQIPRDEYVLDLRVTKAVELIKNNAVVDNDMAAAEEAPAEEAASTEEAAPADAE